MSFMKKKILYMMLVIAIIAVVLVGSFYFSPIGKMICGPCGCFGDQCDESPTCSDGTLYGRCSFTKPKYCNSGTLINNCSACGCPTGQNCNASLQTCYTPTTCSDGTLYGQCSSTKPKYCSSGTLIDNCSRCDCPNPTYICKVDGTCSAQIFDFSMSATPSSANVYQSSSTESRIKVDLIAGTTKNVDLSISGCPPNTVTCNLFSTSPPPVVTLNGYPTFETLLQIVPSQTTPPGTYKINATGTGGGLTRTTSFIVNISACTCGNWISGNCGGVCDYTQRLMTRTCNPTGCNIESSCMASSSCATGFNITATPQSSSAHIGENTTYLLTLKSINGWIGTVNLYTFYNGYPACPPGVGCQFSLNPVVVPQASSNTSTLKMIITGGSTAGSYSILVKGDQIGGYSANTTVNLEVLP